MDCLPNYREWLWPTTFHQFHSSSKEVSYLYWQNKNFNLKTIFHNKPKCFLKTKLIEKALNTFFIESATRGILWWNLFLEISQNSQENTCARVSYLLKKRLWHSCFPVNSVKFLRTPFLTEHLWWLLLLLLRGKKSCFNWFV